MMEIKVVHLFYPQRDGERAWRLKLLNFTFQAHIRSTFLARMNTFCCRSKCWNDGGGERERVADHPDGANGALSYALAIKQINRNLLNRRICF